MWTPQLVITDSYVTAAFHYVLQYLKFVFCFYSNRIKSSLLALNTWNSIVRKCQTMTISTVISSTSTRSSCAYEASEDTMLDIGVLQNNPAGKQPRDMKTYSLYFLGQFSKSWLCCDHKHIRTCQKIRFLFLEVWLSF